MPEFLEDPSVLTKEKLKSELIANNVSLPGGEQRKDVYVQLYLQHLTARNAPGAPLQPDFSSDEERETTPLAGRNRAGGGGGGGPASVGRVSAGASLFSLWQGAGGGSSRPCGEGCARRPSRGRESFPAFIAGGGAMFCHVRGGEEPR